jgi:S-adenosylmethionine-diacylglycerol 3-amino-3-carboxypropyl transferase
MDHPLPTWVIEAAALPVAFAQVREDPLLDKWVVEQIGDGARIIMIASGGCTAAALAALTGVSWLHLVDPNPAQLALSRLKLHLLNVPCEERLALLGHAPLPAREREARVTAALQVLGLPGTALGPAPLWSALGPDHTGRYERLFAQLQTTLAGNSNEIAELLQLRDPSEQARRVAPTMALGRALDAAFDEVMALPNLIRLFGEGATRNRVERSLATSRAAPGMPWRLCPQQTIRICGRCCAAAFHRASRHPG